MLANTRGRLTIPDIARVVAALAVIGALWPVVSWGLDDQAGAMSAGESLLFQILLPATICVLLALSYRAALGGGA